MRSSAIGTEEGELWLFERVTRPAGKVDSVTGETVETHDKARGYEVGENRFLLVEDRELDQARSERPPPGTVQLAEPSRRAPAPSAVRAADPEEDDETGEEQDREEDAEKEEKKRTLLPSSRARRTPAPSKSSASFRRGRLTFGI